MIWVDRDLALGLGLSQSGPLNESQLRHWRRSQRAPVVRASRLRRSGFLSSWYLSRSSGVCGFGQEKKALFQMWMIQRLAGAAFGVESVASVCDGAGVELGLGRDEALALVIGLTDGGGLLWCDSGMISIRGE